MEAMKMSNKNTKIEIRVTDDEKAMIKEEANSVNMDVSTFIRTCLFNKEKVTFLTEGGNIANNISQLVSEIQRANRNKYINNKCCFIILDSLETLQNTFNQLMQKLPDIDYDNE